MHLTFFRYPTINTFCIVGFKTNKFTLCLTFVAPWFVSHSPELLVPVFFFFFIHFLILCLSVVFTCIKHQKHKHQSNGKSLPARFTWKLQFIEAFKNSQNTHSCSMLRTCVLKWFFAINFVFVILKASVVILSLLLITHEQSDVFFLFFFFHYFHIKHFVNS